MPIPPLSNIDRTTLTPIVRAAVESSVAEIIEWQITPILQGRASPAGVYRVRGTARDQRKIVPWSLVVKVHQSAELAAYGGNKASDDPGNSWYWKREYLLYRSGLFNHLPNGFKAARCYHIDEHAQESRLWLEDVREDVGAIWPLEQYGHAARHFGRFNGSYLAGEPIPTWPWLMKEVQWKRVQGNEWPQFWANYPTLRDDNELVQRGWSDELAHGVNRIWEDRELFCHILVQLPQTLNHYDAGRKNLFARRQVNGDLETVAVDWSSVGIGAVGEELSILVSQPVYWFNGVLSDQLPELDVIAFDGYIQGLRDVGWQGDAALARLGYTASVALRGGVGIFILEWTARDQALRTWIESVMGHPMEEIADTMRGFRGFVVACAEEARQLIASRAVTSLAR